MAANNDTNSGSQAGSASGGSPEKDPPQIGTATVALNVVNTIELQCDKHDPEWQRWYDTSADMQKVRSGNDVKWMIDGENTFPLMIEAIKTATGAGHYIYILGWILQLDFNLNERPADPNAPPLPGHSSSDATLEQVTANATKAPSDAALAQLLADIGKPSTLRQLLTGASKQGVQIRMMLWDQLGKTNTQEVDDVNKLDNAGAILDNRTLNLGSHHQKVLIVNGSDGLVAFCGGVDFNADRIQVIPEKEGDLGTPYNDVHCRIKGPAAFDLLHLFRQRWEDHPDTKHLLKKGRGSLVEDTPVPAAADSTCPRQYVQIGRTFGNGSKHAGIGGIPFFSSGYSFAPNGEQTAWRIVQHAVKQAKEFIYLEDQYLLSMDASNLLRDQLGSIKKLVILIPHSYIVTDAPLWEKRKKFIDNLTSGGGADKVAVCVRFPHGVDRPQPLKVIKPEHQWRTYVHTKTWIIDDKFAIIGSANCNNRGYTHDSEVNAGICDESQDAPCTRHFAHDLRMHLWAKHLNKDPAQMFDPIASSFFWFTKDTEINKKTNIAHYDQNADTDANWPWSFFHHHAPDWLIDPNGS